MAYLAKRFGVLIFLAAFCSQNATAQTDSGSPDGGSNGPETTRALGIVNPRLDFAAGEQQSRPLKDSIQPKKPSDAIVRSTPSDAVDRVPVRPRYALVIGNAEYEVGALRNPANDARAVDEVLTALGFQVTRHENLNLREMRESIADFANGLPEQSFAFFFYAGHGMQLDKNNYLVPIDANLKSPTDVQYQTMPLDYVLDSLGDSQSEIRCVALDCCQDNPFARNLQLRRGNFERGLAETRGGDRKNMVIFHATPAGLTALDGKGDNSPYTQALVETMSQRPPRGLLLLDAIRQTGRKVEQSTGQRPYLNIDIAMPDVYLLPPVEIPSTASVGGPKPEEIGRFSKGSIENLGSLKMPASPTGPDDPAESKMNCVALLRQATVYENNGAFDDALEICRTILSLDRATALDQRSARMKRASICLTRGRAEDIKMALMDKLACDEEHMQIAVRVEESALMDQSEKLGVIRRNQVATVDQINGDWIWVKAVQGDSSKQGWTRLTAFVEPPKVVLAKPVEVPAVISKPAVEVLPNPTPTPNAIPPTGSSGNGYPPSIGSLPTYTQPTYTQPTQPGITPGRSPTTQPLASSPNYPHSTRSTYPQQTAPHRSTDSNHFNQPQLNRGGSHSPKMSGSGNLSEVRRMTLAESQKLIDRNNARRWLPGADQQAITRENQAIKGQRQQRMRDIFGH